MKSIKTFYLLAVLVVLFSSCLKDKNLEDRKYGIEGIGELDIAYFVEGTGTPAFFAGNKDTTVRLLTVSLIAKDSFAREDITIKLKRRDDLVTDDPDLELAPDNLFKVSSMDVVIPKGSRTGYITVTGNPADMEGHSYALGFELESTNKSYVTIDGLQKELLLLFETRNAFDGIYQLSGNLTNVTDPLIKGMFNYPIELETFTSNSVIMFSPYFQSSTLPYFDDGDEAYFSGFTPRIYFDDAGKITNLTNAYGQGRADQWGMLDATGVNARDANGNIKVKFTVNVPNAATVLFEADLQLQKIGNRL